MAANFQSLKRWLSAAGLALAVLSASAQATVKRGQAILFSSSDNDEVTTDLPSLTARSPEMTSYAEAVQAPTFKFNAMPKAAPLPAPSTPVIRPSPTDRMRQLLDDRDNWSLLTPSEILGLTKPGKMSGVAERDALGKPKHLTATERFLQREDSRHNPGTNSLFNFNPMTRQDFSDNQQSLMMNPSFLKPEKSDLQNPGQESQFFNDQANAPSTSGQKVGQSAATIWPKLFAVSPQPEQTAAQKADMEAFRKLLRSVSPADTATKVQPSIFGLPPVQSVSGTSSKFTESQMLGASFTPLGNGITKPIDTAQWPTLINQKSPALISLEPEWKPQLPPWMQSGPQPGVIPQRKF